jgi:putative nucleotidyltransferase with HDIG domain
MLKEIDISYKELKELYDSLIHSFVNAIDAKSPWTKGHSERVTSYAVSIGKELGLKESEIEILRTAALLHDVGKIGTYDVILEKPGKLTDEEFALIRLHPVRGEEILKPIKQFKDLLPIVRHHHERLDGRGYPDRLTDDQIPYMSKIITIADSYDSMSSNRPYRPAPPREYAISELKKCSGTQFDPQAVEAFLTVLEGMAGS